MISLFKKPIPVEVIHAEFDSAETRILDQCDKILAELKIPTESQIEKKADMLYKLGFVNSEVIQQASFLKQRTLDTKNIIDITSKQAQSIRYLKSKYPLEKFITIDELNRICDKYKLIHAPAANYIKDIPEKNVLEMANCKKLEKDDKFKETLYLSDFNKLGEILIRELGKENNPSFTLEEMIELNEYWLGKGGNQSLSFGIYDLQHKSDMWFTAGGQNYLKSKYIEVFGSYPRFNKSTIIEKNGIFIAAPNSHFNLEGLEKKSKFGFFNVTVQEVKDPVAFEYCINDICRIITKWGTDDDQSYLDPLLTDETLN